MDSTTKITNITQLSQALGEPNLRNDIEALRTTVEKLAGVGMTEYEIALIIEMPSKVIKEQFAMSIAKGKAVANLQVANALFMAAKDIHHKKFAAAAIWWTKSRMRWTEAQKDDGSMGGATSDSDHISNNAVAERLKEAEGRLRAKK